jgi:hypothetical protein
MNTTPNHDSGLGIPSWIPLAATGAGFLYLAAAILTAGS